MRQEKETKWIEKLKKRGGFTPKRAKPWGDPCSYTECEKLEGGECAYHKSKDWLWFSGFIRTHGELRKVGVFRRRRTH